MVRFGERVRAGTVDEGWLLRSDEKRGLDVGKKLDRFAAR